ncbi:WD40 repeat domain-containing protein [Nonomuraea diastatica]|nr:WD40 repeat domain-containing protein [Nonomuraea diastatica]
MTEDDAATLEKTRLVWPPRRSRPSLLLSDEGARVLVAGTGAHRAPSRLPQVPAVPPTVNDVAQCLVERAGLATSGLNVLLDPATPANLGEALERAAREATSVLMFHYIGHAVFGPDDEPHLATRATIDLGDGVPGYQALPYSAVRDILSSSRAELTVVVLDCCFTGAGRPVPAKAMEKVIDAPWPGAHVLASSAKDENSWALPGVRHTALSGALLRLLNEGDPAGPHDLTLDHVHHHLARVLPEGGFPRPRRQAAAGLGEHPPLALNPAQTARRPHAGPPIASPGDLSSPYRGLVPYTAEQAELFFGRESATRSLATRVRQALREDPPPVVVGSQAFEAGGPLIVTGASGCGKSSLLRAGLIPAMRRDLGDELPCVVLTPGAEPTAALARELAALGGGAPDRLRAVIESDPGAARRALTGVKGRTLLVVDQFEELFIACTDERARRRFVEALADLSRNVAVVLAVRADFFGRCAAYPGLLEAMKRPEIVSPMTGAELRAVIEQPALRSGLSLESGLTDLLLEDLQANADALERSGGPLPLLSHALLATWQRRSGGMLTMAGYRSAGGVTGALASSAEDTLRGLGAEFEPMARDLLIRLVQVDDQIGGTKRRVALAELLPGNPSVAGQVLAEFVRTRLVTVGNDEAEITHEALIRAWPRLGGWIDAGRAGLLVQRRLTEDAQLWQQQEQDPAYLYDAGRLAAALAVVGGRPAGSASHGPVPSPAGPGGAARPGPAPAAPVEDVISRTEREFLDASEQRQNRRVQIARGVIAALSVLLLVAVSGAVVALVQRGQASSQATTAATQRDQALSRQVAATAGHMPDTSLAAQLALSAFQVSPTAEARGALLSTLSRPVGARLVGHTAPVERVVYRPDGRVAATASSDLTARLWNVADPLRPKALGVVKGHTGSVEAVAFSTNGRILATGSTDETARLWDVSNTAKPAAMATLKGHKERVLSVAFSPKGTIMASASADRTVLLWDLTDPRKPKRVAVLQQSSDISEVAFSPDGSLIAVTSSTGGVALLDVRTPAKPTSLAVLPAQDGAVRSVAFSSDGVYLATGSDSGKVHVWNVTATKLVGTASGHGSTVGDVAFSPDGKILASSSTDGTARVWDLSSPSSPQAVATLAGSGGAVTGVAFSPNGQNLATSAVDGTTRLWNVANAARVSPRARLTGHTSTVGGLALSKDGDTLATASDDESVKLWDVSDPAVSTPLSTLSGHTAAVVAASFAPDGEHLVTASLDRTARLWDVSEPATPKLVATLKGHTDGVRSAAYSPDGTKVVTAGKDGKLYLWDVSTPAAPKRVAAPGVADEMLDTVAFRPDSRVIATSSRSSYLRLWDVSKPAEPRRLANVPAHTGGVLDVRFSPDGKTLATTATDGTTRLWDVAQPERPRRLSILPGHSADVTGAAFNANGRTLATASRDGTIRVWNIADRARPVLWAVLTGSGSVNDVEFGPEGTVLAGTSGVAAQLWGLDVEQARANVCETSGMTITKAEWAQYLAGIPYKAPCAA